MKLTKNYPHIHIFGRKVAMPKSLWGRRLLGGALVVGGLLGFLPILGFWMLPLGLFVLSYDSPKLRRFRRRADVALRRRWRSSRFSRYNKKVENQKKDAKKLTTGDPVT